MSHDRPVREDLGSPAWLAPVLNELTNWYLWAVRDLPAEVLLRGLGAFEDELPEIVLLEQPPAFLSTLDLSGIRGLGFEAEGWSVAVLGGLPLLTDPVSALTGGAREAFSCSLDVNGATHLTYAQAGVEEFSVSRPIGSCPLSDLPQPLHPAARKSGVQEQPSVGDIWDPSQNLRLISEYTGALGGVEVLRHLRLLGV